METTARKHACPVTIRWFMRRDLVQVAAIDQMGKGPAWGIKDYVDAMESNNTIGMVADFRDPHDKSGRHDRAIGVMVYYLGKNRFNVIRFVVHEQFRRLGVGTQMIDKLKSKLSNGRRERIEMGVRESNLDLQLFLRTQGFRAVRVDRDGFGNPLEDCYQMRYQLG